MNKIRGIIINPEHGGIDRGIVNDDVCEKDLNLLISTYMYERLCKLNVPVNIIRSSDEQLDTRQRVQRINEAFEAGQDVVVLSHHIKMADDDGVNVIFALRNNDALANKIINNLSQVGVTVKNFYQKRLPSNPYQDYNLIIRQTPNHQSLSIEYNVLGKEDILRFKNNYKKYGEAIIKALSDYDGFKYKKPLKDSEYLVEKGDTLWTIASKNNLTISQLKALNNLSTNTISVDQILKIKSDEQ